MATEHLDTSPSFSVGLLPSDALVESGPTTLATSCLHAAIDARNGQTTTVSKPHEVCGMTNPTAVFFKTNAKATDWTRRYNAQLTS